MRQLSNRNAVFSGENSVEQKILDRCDKMAKHLKNWHVKHEPEYPWRRTTDPYKVLISEMLLRRTRASNVIPVYQKFIKRFPNVKSLSKSSIKEIEKLIAGLGIKSRSVNMKSVAEKIVHNYSGKMPISERNLLSILGPGSRYTINAVRCFAGGERVPIFDVNVKRIFERVFSIEFGKASHKKKISWEIVSSAAPTKNIKQYNWALLDLGKAVCTPENPKCSICPLKSICDYAKNV